MGSWRRQRDQDDQARRSQSRKQPNQIWQPTVPSWEKKFCSTVGSVSWQKLLDIKKYMHLYENVVEWNDSAGEEAFSNAKKRYWAHINGLPCDISLPDPNEYIDEVDWETQIDPELILDLDRGPEALEEHNGKEKVNLFLYSQSVPVTGWGDVEEDVKKDAGWGVVKDVLRKDAGWGDVEEDRQKDAEWGDAGVGFKKNSNNYSTPIQYTEGSKDAWDENYWDSNNHNNWNIYNNNAGHQNRVTWGMNNHKPEAAGGYRVEYKVSRFRGSNDNRKDRGLLRNGRGVRKDNFAYPQSPWIGTH